MTLRLGELCAGYNGLGMAVEEVFGATPAWFSEFDAAPSKILAHHYPDVPNYGDMTKIDWAGIEQADIISGGTPCQDLSAAGKRKGMTEGTRSNLWVQMREAIAIQKPTYVVWENVRGAYSATAASDLEQCPGCMGDTGDGGTVLRALGRVLGDLSDLGYDAQWRGLRASDVGACHARFRVFILAQDSNVTTRGERRLPAPRQAQGWRPRADSGGRSGEPAPHTDAEWGTRGGAAPHLMPTPTVGMTLGGSMARSGARNGEPLLPGVASLFPTPRATDGYKGGPNQRGSSGDLMMPSAVTLLPTVAAHDSGNTPEQHLAKKPGRVQVTSLQITVDHLLPTCTVQDGANTGGPSQFERNTLPLNTQVLVLPHLDPKTPVEEYENLWYSLDDRSAFWVTEERPGIPSVDYWPAVHRWELATGRVSPPPSIPDGRGGKFRLNAAFTEWMMGLPDGWVTDPALGISRNEQLKACGNGVVPQQAAAALRDMLAAFQSQAHKEAS